MQLKTMSSVKSQRITLNPIDVFHRYEKYYRVASKDRSFSEFNNKRNRYKTQGSEKDTQVIFNYKMCHDNKKLSKLPIKSNKNYEMFRGYQLKNQFAGVKNNKKKFEIMFRSKQKPYSTEIVGEMIKTKISPLQNSDKKNNINQQKLKLIKCQDIEINLINLLRILDILLAKGDYGEIIHEIKNYVLEENSDMNDIQQSFAQQFMQLEVKKLIYYQRVALIFLVQSIINCKYKIYEVMIKTVFRQLIKFYSILFSFLTQKPLTQILKISNFKTNLSKLLQVNYQHQNQSIHQISEIKNSIVRKIKFILKNFKILYNFVSSQVDKIKNIPTNLLYFNLLQFYAYRLVGNDWSIWGIQFLETCPSPYVHHTSLKKYTLLLDLDETLIHYRIKNENTGQFLLRPYLFEFLSQVGQHYELGIFTCSLQQYADIIINHMKGISIRFYRQHAVKIGNQLIKDLTRVGRDLSRVILIDNLQKNFRLQKQNGIHIKSWYGDMKDLILKDLSQQLIRLASQNPEDIRQSTHRRSFL